MNGQRNGLSPAKILVLGPDVLYFYRVNARRQRRRFGWIEKLLESVFEAAEDAALQVAERGSGERPGFLYPHPEKVVFEVAPDADFGTERPISRALRADSQYHLTRKY